jgi:hypothetical protein
MKYQCRNYFKCETVIRGAPAEVNNLNRLEGIDTHERRKHSLSIFGIIVFIFRTFHDIRVAKFQKISKQNGRKLFLAWHIPFSLYILPGE